MNLSDLSSKPRCTAKRSNGILCKRFPIRGGTVCLSHGGAAPQVRRKAAERLALLIDPHLPKVAERIIEGLDAQETKFFQKDGIVTDSRTVVDIGERRAYAQLAMEAMQIPRPNEKADQAKEGVTVQIIHVGGEVLQSIPEAPLVRIIGSDES